MSRTTTKIVRNIVKSHYDYWHTFNDIRKDKKTRRIKFMRNGYMFSTAEYNAMAAGIKADLDAAGVKYRDEGFKAGECYHGDYVYYSVVVEA